MNIRLDFDGYVTAITYKNKDEYEVAKSTLIALIEERKNDIVDKNYRLRIYEKSKKVCDESVALVGEDKRYFLDRFHSVVYDKNDGGAR
jgi:hypothetical protein